MHNETRRGSLLYEAISEERSTTVKDCRAIARQLLGLCSRLDPTDLSFPRSAWECILPWPERCMDSHAERGNQ